MHTYQKLIIIATILTISAIQLNAQGSAGMSSAYESRFVVDMPTAGVIPKGTYSIYGLAYTSGGTLIYFDVAPFENFNIGLSYSGTNLLGEGDIIFQKLPGINIRWRIFNETNVFPAILLGVSNQGRGVYYKEFKRFQTFFPGIFASVSKTFKWTLGQFSAHGGLNSSWEQPGGKLYPNLWAGIEHTIGQFASINIELNPNYTDSKSDVMNNSMLLNAQLRISPSKGITLELIARDLFNHTKNFSGFERWFGIEYITNF